MLYDPIGDQYAEPSLRAMNWEGRYLVIGFAAGEIPKVPLNLTLLKGCDVLGVFWGMATQRDPRHANESLREIMQMISDGKLHPDVSASFPLAEGGKAIRMLGSINDVTDRKTAEQKLQTQLQRLNLLDRSRLGGHGQSLPAEVLPQWLHIGQPARV